jgi:hypothetical protein
MGDLASAQTAAISERRAGPERADVEADPATKRGRLQSLGKRAKRAPDDSTGVVAAGCVRRGIVATRETLWSDRRTWPINGRSARIRPGSMGWRMGPYDR